MAKENNKKEPIKKVAYSLDDYKASKNMNVGTKDKEQTFIPISDALREAIGGDIPEGYVTIFRGHSNTSKSTALLECCVGCQRIGTLPIIIDTENSWDWNHARDMGFEFEERIDENGNPYNAGFFMYINNDYLIENYGKLRDKLRNEAVVEDVAQFCNDMLEDQMKEKIKCNIMFAWDSVGTLSCEKGVTSKGANAMWTAAALSVAFNSLLNHKIPASRKEGKKYTNTFIVVNKIWLSPNPGAQPTIMMKGGESFKFSSRLILHFGKTISAGTKALKATSKGQSYSFGIETVVSVFKDHINGVSYSGSLVATPHGFIKTTEVNEYVKKHKDYLLSKLGVDDGDISIDKDNSESDEVDS